MVPNQNTDTVRDVGPSEKMPASKTPKNARKARSKVKNGTRSPARRSASAKSPEYSDAAARLMGGAKSAFNDAYGWAGDSTKRMTKAARKAGVPREYAKERSLIIAAVGLGISVAVGALLMGYGSFGGKRSSISAQTSRKRARGKS